jgi:hypothetical protein
MFYIMIMHILFNSHFFLSVEFWKNNKKYVGNMCDIGSAS